MPTRLEREKEARETRKWADWVERTQQQIVQEASLRSQGGGGGGERGNWKPHPPVQAIPDNDWQGETWGLYFSDIDIEGIQEDPEKYIIKHKLDPDDDINLEPEVTLPPSVVCPAPVEVKKVAPPPPPPVKQKTPPPPPPVKQKTPPPILKVVPPRIKKPVPAPAPRRVVIKEATPPPGKEGKCTFCDYVSVQEEMICHMKRAHKAFI